jgi:hypothetical protein
LEVSERIIGILIISYGKNGLDLRPTWVTTSPLERIKFVSQGPTVLQSHPGLLLPQTQCLISTLYSPPNYKYLKQTFLRVLVFDLSSHSCVLFWMGADTFSHTKESIQRRFPREVAKYVHRHFWSTAKNSKYPSKYLGVSVQKLAGL